MPVLIGVSSVSSTEVFGVVLVSVGRVALARLDRLKNRLDFAVLLLEELGGLHGPEEKQGAGPLPALTSFTPHASRTWHRLLVRNEL